MKMNSGTFFLVFSLALAIAAGGSSAEDGGTWRVYSEEANGDVYFFDASRVRTTPDPHIVWTRIRYKTSVMGASSSERLVEVDCSERTEKTLQRTFFSDRDWERPAMSTDMKEKPKRPIVAGSAAAHLSAILCEE